MRIFTYADPFEINKNTELWSIVTKYPHFCASDTLLQGIGAKYDRFEFSNLSTISNLISRTFGDFTNNPQQDVRLFLKVSEIIRNLPIENENIAFRFNIADVVESIKTLRILKCRSGEFTKSYLTREQEVLLDIYDEIINSEVKDVFYSLENISKERLNQSIKLTLCDETEYLYKTIKNETKRITDLKQANELLDELENSLSVKNRTVNENKIKHIRNLIKTANESSGTDKIIVHGVHRITPIMYYLFKCLKKEGIEIIFLINYAENMPNLYRTWKKVYEWTDLKFEFAEELDLDNGKPLAIAMANIIEGRTEADTEISIEEIIHNNEVKKYSNLTEFAVGEVRKVFEDAEELHKMKTQYYAVKGTESNEILKMYFPKHYEQKPFLSYPIGQFILSLYNMWDFDESVLKVNEKSLIECATSNLYTKTSSESIIVTIEKIKLYFSDIEIITDIYDRLEFLKNSIIEIQNNEEYWNLQKISFFSVSVGEIDEVKSFLEFIDQLTTTLFIKDEKVNFNKHFSLLIDLISKPAKENTLLTGVETQLLSQIGERLQNITGDSVTGSIKDIKHALQLYLEDRVKTNTSNWIVRDFEQIDGAVLLSTKTKETTYNFALLSNANMTKIKSDILTWPLTIEMFNGYKDVESAVPVIVNGILERKGFLKYSLFYGVFFTKCNIQLSYAEEEDGETQSVYYLLEALGLETKDVKHEVLRDRSGSKDISIEAIDMSKIKSKQQELFSICPYKFFLKEVIKEDIVYYSEYHIKYFVDVFIMLSINRYSKLRSNLDDYKNELLSKIEKLFPFWDATTFIDMQSKAKPLESMDKSMSDILSYEEKKLNFLIAKWSIEINGKSENFMNYHKKNKDDIEVYMKSGNILPLNEDVPHDKVCELCNFRDVCLIKNCKDHNA